MSILAIAFPVESALPVAQAFAGAAAAAARPIIGFGVIATFLVLFKPLIAGFLRAALLVLSPRKPLEQRRAQNKRKGVLHMLRLVREYDDIQPSLAAELRSLASRG
jgi:hypothetical protein